MNNHNRQTHIKFVLLLLTFLLFVLIGEGVKAQSSVPNLLSYSDLVTLYENDNPPQPLQTKLDNLLNGVFIDNTLSPRAAVTARRSKGLNVAMWNIERGLEFKALKAALTRDERFFHHIPDAERSKKFIIKDVIAELKRLSTADIVVLNEVDWGLKRTDYRNVARELAVAAKMNYAYAVEFVEVDPLTLGTETLEGENSRDKGEMVKHLTVDKSRTLGLHGTAILSRFPLRNVRVIRFKNLGHDWYADEKKKVSALEKGKRKGAGLVFSEKILREVRRGGRMMILADIEDQRLEGGILTVVATHLEQKTKPSERVKQLEELLTSIKDINHTVVVAGDMNTSGTDSTPTSFEREVKKRMGSSSYWVNKGIKYATGVGFLYDLTFGLIKAQRTKSDPTVKSVRFVSENPEEKFFTTLKQFRFSDGNAFDFRGAKDYSVGGSTATLSDSNERASKGFVSTLDLEGKVTIRLKLDWIFVRPPRLTDPVDRAQPYLMAPQFGRTLKALNFSLKDRISDHSPLIVELPFKERAQ